MHALTGGSAWLAFTCTPGLCLLGQLYVTYPWVTLVNIPFSQKCIGACLQLATGSTGLKTFWDSASRFVMLSLAWINPLPPTFRRRQWQPTPVLLPGKSMDRGAWWAAVHGVAKCRSRLSDFTFTFPFHALEKEMATFTTSPTLSGQLDSSLNFHW